MMDDYTSIEGSHISLQPNNHHDQEWFERIELNQIPRNTCTRSIEIRSTKGCYIGDNGKLPLEQTISRWLLKTDQYPNNPMMCPMNMMVLHSNVGHMMIPSSPRLYRIESIGWTNFIPDRSIPFILMMCEHGWRDYSANQQISKIIQIRFDWHFIIRCPTDWKEPPAEDGSEDMNLTRRSNSTYFSSWWQCMTSPAIKIHFNVIPHHYRMIHSIIPSKDPPGYHFKINCRWITERWLW